MKIIITESQYKKWFLKEDESDEMSEEEMLEKIKERERYIEKVLPKVIRYFKSKYKDELVKIDIDTIGVGFGHANYYTNIPRLEFYFNNSLINRATDIKNDLSDVFDIDLSIYGTPLRLRVYEQTWKLTYG